LIFFEFYDLEILAKCIDYWTLVKELRFQSYGNPEINIKLPEAEAQQHSHATITRPTRGGGGGMLHLSR